MRPNRKKKATAVKTVFRESPIGKYGNWTVYSGELELKRSRGRKAKLGRLFTAVAEKLPKASLAKVCKDLKNKLGHRINGVYVAHDSMGYPRYIGRGNIRGRLASCFNQHQEELMYYSFYVIDVNVHERDVETLLIHSAGPLLDFNEKKKKAGIKIGSVKDFEVGTVFYERQSTRGRRIRTKHTTDISG